MKIKRGDRYDIIGKIVKGKTVLDIGCVDHNFKEAIKIKGGEWLHGFICKKAKKCIGIDIEKREVEKLKKIGYNCINADAENFNLKEKFDVIVAGELIEHIYNAGKFLEIVKRHLKKNGKFILTTPNPYFFKHILQILLKGRPHLRHDHTCIYDPQTLSYLLERHGFKVEDVYWTNFSPKKYKLGYWISYLGYLNANFLIISSLGTENEKRNLY